MQVDASGPPLAFGAEPSRYRFRLRLARRQALAERLNAYLLSRGFTPAKPARLADLGSGRGALPQYLQPYPASGAVSWFGVDISPARLNSMYRREQWKRVRADLEKGAPFRSSQFDIVVCEQVLEHLSDPHLLLRTAHRLLRPHGLLVAGVPIFPAPVAWLRRHLRQAANEPGAGSHIQSFSLAAFHRLLASEDLFRPLSTRGFRVISGGPFRALENYRWWWQLNGSLGRRFPSLCIEVQTLAERL